MKDHFFVLGVERRPWLELEELKRVFHAMAAECHPDVYAAGEDSGTHRFSFVELNLAYRVLRDPVTRLGHLLELEKFGLGEVSGVVEEFEAIFMKLGGLGWDSRGHSEKQVKATSALEKSLCLEDAAALKRRWEELRSEVEERWAQAESELRAQDQKWMRQKDRSVLREIAALRQRFAVLAKWREQIGEAVFRLETV